MKAEAPALTGAGDITSPSRQQLRAKARAQAFQEVSEKYGLEPRRARRRIALRWARERARQQLAALKGAATTALAIATLLGVGAVSALAQGSRKDDIVLNGRGQPLAGATIRVCTATATGQPCTPLASIFSDQALTQALVNPTTTDGLGNYSFYAAPGRYMIEISGTGITTKQIPNVILPNDPSSPTFSSITTTSGISAFSLTLSGNLTVSGSAAVTGSLTVGGAAVPSTGVANTWAADQYFASGRPIYDVMGKGASGSNQSTTGTVSAGSTSLTLAAAQDFKNTQGIAVYGAGPLSTLAAPTGLTVTPTNIVSTIVSAPVGVSRSANVVTITTTFPHYFQVGQSVTVAGTAGCTTSPNGTFTVATAPTGITFTYAQTAGNETCGGGTVTIAAGTTTYSYQVAAIDASGGLSAPAASVSTTTGYAALGPSTFVRLSWNCVTNAVMYAVYGRSGSLVSQQVAGPCDKGATTKTADDLGNTLPVPTYVPNAVPTGATNQVLLTAVSSGGGTTTLTLAASATAAVANATVQHDDTAAVQAAIAAARASGGVVYLPIGTHNFWNLDFRTFGSPQSWWAFKFDGILSPHIPIVLGSLVAFQGGTQMSGVNMFDNRTPYALIQHNNINPVIAIPGLTNPSWAGYFAISGHVGDGIRISSKDPANVALNVTIERAYVAANDAATGSPLRIDEGASGVGGFNYSVKGGTYRSGPTSMYPSIWATTTQDLHVQDDVVLVNSGPRLDGASFTTAVNGKAVFRNILTESFKTPFLLLDGTGGVTAMITIDRLEMADNIFNNITLLENLGPTNINNITVTNSTGWNNVVTTYSNNLVGLRIFGDRAGSQIGPGTNTSWTVFDSSGNITAGGSVGQQYTFGSAAALGGQLNACRFEGIRFLDAANSCNWVGTTADAQISSAIADLPAAGGIVDARGYGATTQTIAAQLQIGSATRRVTLLVDYRTNFQVTITSGVSAIQIFEQSAIVGSGNGSCKAFPSGFSLASTANVSALVANGQTDATQEFFGLEGVCVQGHPSATVSSALVDLQSVFVNSYIRNVNIDNFPTIGLRIRGAAGAAVGGAGAILVDNVWVNGENLTGARPVVIQTQGTNNPGQITFLGGAIEHQGTGNKLVEIDGLGSPINGVAFYGTGFENRNNVADANTVGISIKDANNVTLDTVLATGLAGGDLVRIAQSAANLTRNVALRNVRNFVYANTVNDQINTLTVTDNYVPEYIFPQGTDKMRLAYPVIATGVSQGSGFKHQRVASCTTAAAAGSTCTTTITWTSAFADANYTATCTIDNPTGVPYVLNTSSKLGASVVVTIATLTAVAASGSLNCVGAHD